MDLEDIAFYIWRRMISGWSERSFLGNIVFLVLFLFFASLSLLFVFLFYWGVFAYFMK